MTNELYIKILNTKNNEKGMGKIMKNNAPSHISDKTIEFIKNIKMK